MAGSVPEVTADPTDAPAPDAGIAGHDRRSSIAVVALVVGAMAALVWGGVLLNGSHPASPAGHDAEPDALAAAERLVEAMTTVDGSDIDAGLDTVRENSTGTFKKQFQDQRDAYREAVTEAGVSAEGEVIETGVVSATDDEVMLLMAVSSTITNKQVPTGDRRAYRMRVTVVREGTRWLVSKLELVA